MQHPGTTISNFPLQVNPTNLCGSAKLKEAALYIFKQILDEFDSYGKDIGQEAASAYLEYIRLAMQDRKSKSI